MAVPWFIGSGNALHSPEVARTVSYAAMGGAEGVIGINDMAVSQLAVPGSSVQVAPGAIALLNRSAGATSQMYIDKVLTTDQIPIAATGVGISRSDLLVRRVKDPDYPPWVAPPDTINGPYSDYAIISGVPAGTKTAKALNLGYPAVALARIDVPPSTATILNAHIINLRKVARPRRQREVDAVFPTAVQSITSTTVWKVLGTSRAIAIPEWASYVTWNCTLTGLALLVGNSFGLLQANFANLGGQSTTYDENWVSPAAGYSRCTYACLGELYIPPNLRETDQTMIFYGKKTSGPGNLQADTGTSLFVDVEFSEKI